MLVGLGIDHGFELSTLTQEQLEHFDWYGFVAVEGVIDPEEVIDPVVEEYAGVLDRLADELYEEGKIGSRYEELEFGERVTRVYAESGRSITGISTSRCLRVGSRRILRFGLARRCSVL